MPQQAIDSRQLAIMRATHSARSWVSGSVWTDGQLLLWTPEAWPAPVEVNAFCPCFVAETGECALLHPYASAPTWNLAKAIQTAEGWAATLPHGAVSLTWTAPYHDPAGMPLQRGTAGTTVVVAQAPFVAAVERYTAPTHWAYPTRTVGGYAVPPILAFQGERVVALVMPWAGGDLGREPCFGAN